MSRPPVTYGVAVLALAGVLVTGCEDLQASRRTATSDVCAAALPAGQAAVGSAARLVGVRRVSATQADALFGFSGGTQPSRQAPAGTLLCVLAYRGPFRATGTPGPGVPTGGAGAVELVLVTTRHPRVLTTLVTPSLPEQLR